MREEEREKTLARRYELTKSDVYKDIVEEMKNRVFEIPVSDEKEFRGLAKMVKWVLGWGEDYENYINTKKGEK